MPAAACGLHLRLLLLPAWLLLQQPHRSFGVNYASSCVVDLGALLAQLDYSSTGPRFYDPFLMTVRGCRGGADLE